MAKAKTRRGSEARPRRKYKNQGLHSVLSRAGVGAMVYIEGRKWWGSRYKPTVFETDHVSGHFVVERVRADNVVVLAATQANVSATHFVARRPDGHLKAWYDVSCEVVDRDCRRTVGQYSIYARPDGDGFMVGCEYMKRAEALKLFKWWGDKLGYDVED